MSFSATDAAFEGFRLARRSPMTLVWWSLAYLVMMGAMFAVAGAGILNMMTMAERLESAGGEPTFQELLPFIQTYAALMGWILPLALVFGAVLNAAVARAVLHPEQKAFGYLRLGGDELRVLAVTIVLGVVFGLLGGLMAAAIGAAAGFATAGDQPALWLAVVLGVIVALVVFLWLGIRLSLAVPITVAERRIAIFDSFGVTKGKFWSLFGMSVIAVIMVIIVSLLGGLIIDAVGLVTGGLGGLEQLDAQNFNAVLRDMWPALAVFIIGNAIMSALQLGILYAPYAAAYRGITGR
jgi:hypothetical protein